MSPQEVQMLQDFLGQLTQAHGISKDPQADALIAGAVAKQPDAAYLLVQRALLMDQALNAAKAQISTLQSQLQTQAQSAPRSFLDSANVWGNSQTAAPRPAAAPMPAPAQYQPAMPYQPQPAAPYQAPLQAPAPAAASGFLSGGAGNLLGNVAATAAGVAGGAFLFQGIEHMMGHNSGSGFFDHQQSIAPLAAPVENTTINNYYIDDNHSSNDTADSGSDVSYDNAADVNTDDDLFI
jgi:hypothetical protein